ncbi:molybdenum cofactor guanylyltransferase MobA [uncultured Thiocystis sp.]|jgi:molybdopterin-guanine dinucleotide biosynthesis protein A|uniref:molybdenum cofactor guanylyltransferase MobA n=1 Tax=uncultured Thiocystis sp. TaxID=1202134 RepID=UPI0025FCEADA|nr:molybdenum cofactor guanylyltransferase MobA [uncultured Thiocystis sp.]
MTIAPPSKLSITGVILAGGQARRMGGRDKGLLPFAGRPLVEWAIESLAPQVSTLLISANRNLDAYGAYGFPVVADLEQGFQGPLAGILSAMHAARTAWILTLPCDGPQPPPDLGARLAQAVIEQDAELAVAVAGARRQSVHALVPVALSESLRDFLAAGERKVDLWHARHRVALVDFSDRPGCFANLNAPEDACALEPAFIQALPTGREADMT